MLWNVKNKCVQIHKYIIAKGSDYLGVNLRFISLELCFQGQFSSTCHLYFLIYKMGLIITLTHWNLTGWNQSLYICFCCRSVSQSCPTLCNPVPVRFLCQWGLPGKNTGILLPFPPPGALPNPGTEPHLLNLLQCQVDSLLLGHQGSPFLRVSTLTVPST